MNLMGRSALIKWNFLACFAYDQNYFHFSFYLFLYCNPNNLRKKCFLGMHKETCLPVHKLCVWQAILWWHYDLRHFCIEVHSTLLQSVVPLISSIFFIELRSNFSMELFCWTCDQCTGFPFSDEIVLITVFLIITLSHLNFSQFLPISFSSVNADRQHSYNRWILGRVKC